MERDGGAIDTTPPDARMLKVKTSGKIPGMKRVRLVRVSEGGWLIDCPCSDHSLLRTPTQQPSAQDDEDEEDEDDEENEDDEGEEEEEEEEVRRNLKLGGRWTFLKLQGRGTACSID